MKTTLLFLPSALTMMFLVSCEMPAPIIISNPQSSPAPAPGYVPPIPAGGLPTSPVGYAYPNIAGVWQSPSATITIGHGSGGTFPISVIGNTGNVHASTGHWGQPYHRHFTFKRNTGRTARATLNSLNPTTISIEEEDGRIRNWTRKSSL